MKRWFFILLIILIVCPANEAQKLSVEIIKAGTLAPEGSDWSVIFKQMNDELIERSKNRLQFRFFYGRDEKELVELLKNQQIDAALISSAALGTIESEIFALQLPLLFAEYAEFEYVRKKLSSYFSELFENEGYVMLGWGDMGFIYLFSKEPVKTQTDLQKLQFWAYEIDPISQAFSSAAGREPVLLPVHSVLPSLVKGDLQAIYAPPLGCITLQWFTQVIYMTDLKLAFGLGCTLMNQSRFNKLAAKDKKLLLEITTKYHEKLNVIIRQKNQESMQILTDRGMKIVQVPRREEQKWIRIADRVQKQFIGDLYPKALLDRIKRLKLEYQGINR